MRFLLAGLVMLGLSVGLAEYDRRHPPASPVTPTADPAARPELAAGVKALLATTPSAADAPAPAASAQAVQAQLKTTDAKVGAFSTVTEGPFQARELRGGFGAVLFVVDGETGSAIVRAVAGEGAKVVAARSQRITSMQVDGSTVFFAEGGRVLSMSARGDEAPVVRVSFTSARITSLAPVGDTVYVTLMPNGPEPEGVVAKVESNGTVSLIASEQVKPHDVLADGKDVFWLAGATSSLFRAPADGSFTSRVLEGADAPLALDGDALVARVGDTLSRVSRAGGAPLALAPVRVDALAVSSGLTRYASNGAVYEVTAGAAPTELFKASGTPVGVALGGMSLYVLVSTGSGSALYAK
jgi:hypothetical protein